ncbi:hypothetical protein INT43_002358 [Umbelopsis isabellina]|uniref:Galactose oxidase n=1 Tax=Mortierella isabellina TaxID=91625 RepID=A0A8H7Q5H3_MORIS|nr:hypothetical protein INT43_002358 [Umbelopsis isabellina]
MSAADMRAGHCAFATNSTLYIFGGKSTNNQTIHRFISLQVANTSNYENAQWNILNDSQSFNIVNGACAITSTGKAIMLGYDESSKSPSPGIQVYDTNTDTWIGSSSNGLNVSDTFGNLADMASAIAGDKMIIFGGSAAGTPINRTTFILDTTTSPWNWTQLPADRHTPTDPLGGSMLGIERYAYHVTINSTTNNSCIVHAFDSKKLRWVGQVGNQTNPAQSVMLAGSNLTEQVWMIPASLNEGNTGSRKRADSWNTQMLLFGVDEHEFDTQVEANSTYNPRSGSTATLVGNQSLAIFGGNGNDSNLLVYDLGQNQMVSQWSAVQVPIPAQQSPQPSPSNTTNISPNTYDDQNRKRILGICLGTILGGICVLLFGFFILRHHRQKDKTAFSATHPGNTRTASSLEKSAADPSNMPPLNQANAPPTDAGDASGAALLAAAPAIAGKDRSPLSRSVSATVPSSNEAVSSRFTEHFGKAHQPSVTPAPAVHNRDDELVASQIDDTHLMEPRPAFNQAATNSDDSNNTSNGSSEVPPFRRSWS